MGHCFILRQHAETPVIKGLGIDTPLKLVSFWDNREKITSRDRITPRTLWIPRPALTDKGITGLDITISPIGTVLAQVV